MSDQQAIDALSQLQDVILTKMWDAARGSEFGDDGIAFGLKFFEPIPREIARGMLRDMKDRGYVQHMKGLWSEDGEPRGAGYGLTQKAIRELRSGEREAYGDQPWEVREAGRYGPPGLADRPFDASKEYGGNGSIPF
ncbi:hypothetical protein FDH38_gp007 [Dinoroseobacter phage vB_DshS-R5C]|uniref:Uncharacterized protein n=1 Tax=Dinoroseobacter phage vB_DshS-R5C TaxID=1965368 RepID=A0A1V0DY32_9CAUD|nr:hypothetical protein FDH38_gp007 [Dinoroseobacter phage vB_DshS-R5C]ARB06061.1 hypothetical protein vBDshSR5C_7 [Dinoroseobacter phage vB_DshS-R5C]